MDKEGKVSNVSMDAADNGVTISYSKQVKREGKGTYDCCSSEYKKEVFEDVEKGFDRFKELFMEAHGDKFKKKEKEY